MVHVIREYPPVGPFMVNIEVAPLCLAIIEQGISSGGCLQAIISSSSLGVNAHFFERAHSCHQMTLQGCSTENWPPSELCSTTAMGLMRMRGVRGTVLTGGRSVCISPPELKNPAVPASSIEPSYTLRSMPGASEVAAFKPGAQLCSTSLSYSGGGKRECTDRRQSSKPNISSVPVFLTVSLRVGSTASNLR